MAIGQKKHKKHFDPTKKGANDPTQASAPSAQKYRFPIEKGLGKLNPKTDADGNPIAISEYGRRFSGPSSVSVPDSDAMADIDIASDRDATLEALKVGAGSNNAVADQLRSVSAQPYPVAGGGSMKRQQDPSIFDKAKPSLPAGETNNQTEPVRKP
jgi:hypothetical protein